MSLKQQILQELKEQNDITQAEIKKCEDDISAEAFAMSTINGGALAGAAISACQSRMQAATSKKDRLKRENAWISEMLSKYR